MNSWLKTIQQYASLESDDSETQVGCVILNGDMCVSFGTNRLVKSTKKLPTTRPDKYPYMIHAEIEALIFAGQDAQGCVMLVTHSPCKECAKAIICAGIKRVIYNEQHGLQEEFEFVKELLEDAGIVLEKI